MSKPRLDLAARVRSQLDSSHEINEDVSRACGGKCSFELHLDARSALVLGQARGVALLVGARAAIEVSAYPPALVKRSIAGSGQAPKDQLARIVGAILGWTSLPAEDATDALAIAITHANAALVKRRTAPRANSLPGRSGL